MHSIHTHKKDIVLYTEAKSQLLDCLNIFILNIVSPSFILLNSTVKHEDKETLNIKGIVHPKINLMS